MQQKYQKLLLMNGQFSARHHTTQFISPERKNTGEFGPGDWKWEGFARNDTTLPAQLKAVGYRTGAFVSAFPAKSVISWAPARFSGFIPVRMACRRNSTRLNSSLT